MKRHDFLTRSQLQAIHNLKSDRNAQRVLKEIEGVSVTRHGENVYFLNAKGRELTNCEKVRKHTSNVEHYIMRNQLFIEYGQPASWETEIRIRNGSNKANEIIVVADAIFERNKRQYIVEVDNQQKMIVNKKKINKYRQLVERKAFGIKSPIFLWVTTTEYRRKQLSKLCEGLEVYIYTLDDFNKGGN